MKTNQEQSRTTQGEDQAWVAAGWSFWISQFNEHKVSDKRAIWELTMFLAMFNRNEGIC